MFFDFRSPGEIALCMPNIAYQIAQDTGLSKVDALNLALTARPICAPALDGLWSMLSSLIPLFRYLPRDMWRIDQLDGKPHFILLRGLREDDDISMFLRHAYRVRHLSVDILGVSRRALARIIEARMCCGGLFPRLLEIRIHGNRKNLPLLLSTAGKLLKVLYISMPDPPLIPISRILSRSPKMERVLLDGRKPYVHPMFPTANLQSTRLHSLMPSLRRLPWLHTVVADQHLLAARNLHQQHGHDGLPSRGFNMLNTLVINAGDRDPCCAPILTQLDTARLENIRLTDMESIDQPLLAIEQMQCVSTLTTLSLTERSRMVQEDNRVIFDCEAVLRPLLNLNSLRQLHVEAYPIRITAQFLARLAASLPCIERLALSTASISLIEGGKLDCVGFPEAVEPFAQHCPRLVSLLLDIDPRKPFPETSSTVLEQNALRTLNIGLGAIIGEEYEALMFEAHEAEMHASLMARFCQLDGVHKNGEENEETQTTDEEASDDGTESDFEGDGGRFNLTKSYMWEPSIAQYLHSLFPKLTEVGDDDWQWAEVNEHLLEAQ